MEARLHGPCGAEAGPVLTSPTVTRALETMQAEPGVQTGVCKHVPLS